MNKSKGKVASQDPNKPDKAGRTKIFSFTSSGNFETVKSLVERGANVNHRDHAGWSPLHVAALKGQHDIAEYLIQNGSMLNARGFENDTPLHDACSSGHAECVKLLVCHGANVYALNSDQKRPIDVSENDNCTEILKAKMLELDKLSLKDNQERTCLHRACIQGNFKDVISHLQTGINANSVDIHQKSPLHHATQQGKLDIVRALVDHGANIHAVDSANSTPLHAACQRDHVDVVDFLIQAGADVYAVDNDNKTPYQTATSTAVRQLITTRIDQERKERVITEAIDEVTFISNSKHRASISSAAALNSSSTVSSTKSEQLSREERKIQAIMKSFENAERKKKARQMKRASMDSSSDNCKRKRSLSIQSRESSIDVDQHDKKSPSFSRLDPFKEDTSGRTNLHKWAIRGNVEAVERLLEAGADPCQKDNAGYTALHEAALRGRVEVVHLLLRNNADVNCKGAKFDTPLHDATENGLTDVVRLLLDYGADTECRNTHGFTALDIAIAENHTEIIALFENHKAVEPKKRKTQHRTRSESLTLPITQFEKVHARQLSVQHLPKKSYTTRPDNTVNSPIPTPLPEKWLLKGNKKPLYPSTHSASRHLPLYTIQSDPTKNHFLVLDLQISLLLGMSVQQFTAHYPLLYRQPALAKEKERLWSPLSTMISADDTLKHIEKQTFLDMDLSLIRLDQIINLIKSDYSHLSESVVTVTLDTTSPENEEDKNKQSIKLPPKFALKMRKCGFLK